MSYKLGSLFDGSGGFPLSGALCGVEPVWAAEVEPYPIAVTRSRFPNMKHLGDISKVHGGEIEPVDIITFGSPCQDLSVAGKRAGLKHEANGDEETTRSGLFMEAVRIIKEMRSATNGKYPRFALWENVPGAFSSNKGEDFRIVCEELIKIVEPSAFMPSVPKGGWTYADSYIGDGWSLAYRVFDAQYWGVPQRRRRIHLIADFSGQCAREVLFERQGVRGYFAEGRTPWQTTPADAQGGTGADDTEGEGFDGYNGDLTGGVSATLGVNCGLSSGRNGVIERGRQLDAITLEPGIAAREGGHIYEGVSGTLRANMGDNQMAVAHQEGNYIDVEMEVAVRKYEVNCSLLCELLRQQKALAGISNKDIAERLDLPLTMVEHWFRKDTYFAVPEPEVWPKLKALLDIKTDEFDQSIMTFEYKGGTYDMRNRIHLGDTAPTLTCGSGNNLHLVPKEPVYSVENHPADSRVNIDDTGKVQTLTSRMGTGGGNVPMVMEPFCKSARAQTKDDATTWKHGKVANTLNTFDQGEARTNELVVAYSFDSLASNSMKSSNPHSGCREVVVGKTLDTTDPNPSKNQGGIAIVQSVICLQGNGIDRADTAGCNGKGWKEDFSYTLNTIDRPAVAYLASGKDTVGTLMANAGSKLWLGNQEALSGDYHILEEKSNPVRYIVRRLTPTECARLQGFADWWGIVEQKDRLTDEEYQFWLEVRNTHAAINGKKVQDYTEKQMLTWYNKLWTDSAEYKMWGNGIALPPALYCLQGIVDALNKPEEDDDSWLM